MITLESGIKRHHVGGQALVALDNVTLRLAPGEFVAIIGPSGSGKSTLLNTLGLLDSLDEGRLTIDGTGADALDDRARSKFRLERIGFIFQAFNLLPGLRAWENVAVPGLIAGRPLSQCAGRARELLEKVGLEDRADHVPAQLSGGQMQRVAIARALFMEPALILADEPTGNLDSKTGGTVLKLLRDVAATPGRAVVTVTHDPAIAAIADRVISLRDGRIVSNDAGAAR